MKLSEYSVRSMFGGPIQIRVFRVGDQSNYIVDDLLEEAIVVIRCLCLNFAGFCWWVQMRDGM